MAACGFFQNFSKLQMKNSIEELNIICDFAAWNETRDIETLGYRSLFSDLTNADSNKFMCKAISDVKLLTAANNILDWDRTQSDMWMGRNHQAMLHLCVLCHILQGVPGRLTEELMMQINNKGEISQAKIGDGAHCW